MLDLVIQNGQVVTADGSFAADIGIAGGRIVTLGLGLDAPQKIDAAGKLVLPGGVDSHCHIEQLSAAGIMNADTFESATRSAALGGTTTVISFAAQHVGMRLKTVVDDYAALARKGALVDYAFHLIMAEPRPDVLDEDLPELAALGHASIKMFLTYDKIRLEDAQALAVLAAARRHGMMVCIHAENHGMIQWLANKLVERGYTHPKYHAVSHPRLGEAEAIDRAAAMSLLLDQPVMIFHVSTVEGLAAVRRARAAGAKLWAETCTHYLVLTKADLDRPGGEGAKWICSPPLRDAADQEALWQALADGTLQTVSSDHAPYAADASGKYMAGPEPGFKQVPNGMPGLAFRLPILWDQMVNHGHGSPEAFVRLACTEPARLYGLDDRKGSITIGKDADLLIWDPARAVTLTAALAGDNTGYTPFEGMTVKGWPTTVLRRGEVIVAGSEVRASPGSGRFLARQGGPAAQPTGRLAPELDPTQNFGAELLESQAADVPK
ncbi:MAG: dihydropyrimidinase [Geminicoccaceae bacterium]|nr:MAG: dihydropyrimidinase [Geminicoccaceae bacterium]